MSAKMAAAAVEEGPRLSFLLLGTASAQTPTWDESRITIASE